MLEIYLIITVICFILMTIFVKIHDGEVLVSDLFLNLIASLISIVNIFVVFLMLITTDAILKKKVF